MDERLLSQIKSETIDWTKPIVWDDGTPAEVLSFHHGQVYILLDIKNLPTGMKRDGSQDHVRYTKKPYEEGVEERYYATNVMGWTGGCMNPAVSITAYIINESQYRERTAMTDSPVWAMF